MRCQGLIFEDKSMKCYIILTTHAVFEILILLHCGFMGGILSGEHYHFNDRTFYLRKTKTGDNSQSYLSTKLLNQNAYLDLLYYKY